GHRPVQRRGMDDGRCRGRGRRLRCAQGGWRGLPRGLGMVARRGRHASTPGHNRGV
ncbi:MAG: hypothetical protein AVDCRST_MAG25-1134, partial [uncultured Rubrobacteraceae bacterium]